MFGNNVYLYFTAMAVAAVIGFFIQVGIKSDDEKVEKTVEQPI